MPGSVKRLALVRTWCSRFPPSRAIPSAGPASADRKLPDNLGRSSSTNWPGILSSAAHRARSQERQAAKSSGTATGLSPTGLMPTAVRPVSLGRRKSRCPNLRPSELAETHGPQKPATSDGAERRPDDQPLTRRSATAPNSRPKWKAPAAAVVATAEDRVETDPITKVLWIQTQASPRLFPVRRRPRMAPKQAEAVSAHALNAPPFRKDMPGSEETAARLEFRSECPPLEIAVHQHRACFEQIRLWILGRDSDNFLLTRRTVGAGDRRWAEFPLGRGAHGGGGRGRGPTGRCFHAQRLQPSSQLQP